MHPGGVPVDGFSYVETVMNTFDTSADFVEDGSGKGNGCIGSNGTLSNRHGDLHL